MPEFFLELFSEEIPARMQAAAAGELARICDDVFKELAVATEAPVFHGPRRLGYAATIAHETPGEVSEARGPRETAPEAALHGFLGKHKADRGDVVVEDGYYLLRKKTQPVSARRVIEEQLPAALRTFRWPKSMRWGQGGDFSWVRPLRRIICLLDGAVVPIVLGPLTASNETEGHRLFMPNVFSVASAEDWEEKLRRHKVHADEAVRTNEIVDGLNAQAKAIGAVIVRDDALVQEVCGLVEWPVPMIGKIDVDFMSLPPEVRELSMKVNQKYFALRDAEGRPAPYFAFVANLEAPDGGAAIIAGNERVLRARLADARHFWDLDLKTPLDALLPKLDKIVFHARLGTQRQRAERIARLARQIAQDLAADDGEAKQAEWAGLLCKADLVTGMVGEFPELQGVMGGYYAERLARGWDGRVVGAAIRTHYQPKGPDDAVPTGHVAVSVALADKLDMLTEFFRIGETPTGSGDPYALRRAALGVIRIILQNQLRLPLRPLLADDEKLFDFIIERLRVKLRNDGKRYDVLDAVLGAGADDDLVRLMQRVAALEDMLGTGDGRNLLVAYRRAANILKIEGAKDGPHRADGLQALSAPEEQELSDVILRVRRETIEDLRAGRYGEAMTAFARLRAPVDAFFDKVTVNAPEPELRLNRLRLLAQLRDTMHQIADFSKIEG